jgi:hypothetical protein
VSHCPQMKTKGHQISYERHDMIMEIVLSDAGSFQLQQLNTKVYKL